MHGNCSVGWLLAGTGDLARKRLAAALAGAPGSRLVGVVGQLDRAEAIARQWGGAAFATLDDALARCADADAVYVATPVDRHAGQAIAALRAGRHVIVEKPLGVSPADAARIADAAAAAAAQQKLLAGCAYYRRCSARFAHARRVLQCGELGRIVSISMRYRGWFAPETSDAKHWRVDPSRSGGGPVADVGSHMLDVLIGLVGMPRRVFAKVGTLVHNYAAEDSATVLMEMPDGAQVSASFGWSSRSWAHDFEIAGSEGALTWSPFDSGTVALTRGRERDEVELPPAENVHVPLVDDFVRAVREGRPAAVPLEEALKTNVLLDAIYRSGQSGREELL
jgi:predicted dehydrogenase